MGAERHPHDHKKSIEDLYRPDHETANAPQQAQHHRNNADQPKFPDESLKSPFNPTGRPWSIHVARPIASTDPATELAGLDRQDMSLDSIMGLLLERALIIKIDKNGDFSMENTGQLSNCRETLPSAKKQIALLAVQLCVHGQSRGGLRPSKSEIDSHVQALQALRTCCRHRYAMLIFSLLGLKPRIPTSGSQSR